MSDDSLSPVGVESIPTLRDLFLVEWPKYMNAWNTLDSQYRYLTHNTHFPVQILLPYGNHNNGVVVIWSLVEGITDISLYCIGDHTKLKEALLTTDRIKWSTNRVIFCCVREELYECCMDIFNTKIPHKTIKCDQTYITHIDRDIAKHFEYEIPPDVKIVPAIPSHAPEIDLIWPHRHPGSDAYFSRMIGFGLATALIGQEGDLRAWILTSVRGDQHALQVKDEFKKRGYGQLLVKWLGRKLSHEEREVFGCVVTNNTPSQNMYNKMNFKQLFITNWIFTVD